MIPIVQIAGIIDQQEADMVIRAGASHIGFPLRLDVNQEDLSDQEASEIVASLSDPGQAVLITYLRKPDEISALMNKLGCSRVQIHGAMDLSEIKLLKRQFPQYQIWKSLVVKEDNMDDLRGIISLLEPWVEAFITDTFDPDSGASGATGKTHDWEISRKLCRFSKKPVILAGGLNPENVAEAIWYVRPAGVDVHTGVEGPDGRKVQGKVEDFVKHARKAFHQIEVFG